MTQNEDVMKKFDFLLGNWQLEYRIPKSPFSEADTGSGRGTFKRMLDDKYVCFDYGASLTASGEGEAHGIFAWDPKADVYRYWWFENSGNFLAATCNFTDDETLLMNWHDTLLIQTFKKAGPDRVILKMEHPLSGEKYEPIMEVILTRES